jgi:glutathione reductase (NADPH)
VAYTSTSNLGLMCNQFVRFAANAATQINNAQGFGFDIEVKNFSWKKLKQGRDNYIKGITDWYDGYLSLSMSYLFKVNALC